MTPQQQLFESSRQIHVCFNVEDLIAGMKAIGFSDQKTELYREFWETQRLALEAIEGKATDDE